MTSPPVVMQTPVPESPRVSPFGLSQPCEPIAPCQRVRLRLQRRVEVVQPRRWTRRQIVHRHFPSLATRIVQGWPKLRDLAQHFD
jgi:hypothetical protein